MLIGVVVVVVEVAVLFGVVILGIVVVVGDFGSGHSEIEHPT